MSGEEKTAGKEKKETGKAFLRKNRKKLLGTAVLAVGILLLGAWLFRTYGPQRIVAKPVASSEVGTIDLQKALKAHDAYNQLRELREQREAMAADLAVENEEALAVKPPELSAEPFQAAVQQKTSQMMKAQAGEMLMRRRQAEKKKREDTKDAYAAKQKAIDDSYLNDLLNLRLQLANSDAMVLSPEKQQGFRDDLKAQIRELEQQRGEQQRSLSERYERAIQAYVNAIAQQDTAKLQADDAALTGRMQSEEAATQSAAQARDAEIMQQQMMQSGQRSQRLAEKKAALAAKEVELQTMEEHMLNDIAGKAAKLAIEHHLTLVLANPSVNLQAIDIGMLHVGPWPEKYTPVIGAGTVDLTDELMDELSQ